MRRGTVRRWRSRVMVGVLVLCAVLAVLPLLLILGTLIAKGAGSINLDFFTKTPVPAGESGGGVVHAIVGTLVMVGTACLFGLPVGIGAGIFASEWPGSPLARVTRFIADVLNGTPSIVIGVFAWTLIVAKQKHFSGFAGSAALAVLMIPMVMRTTEEMIKLVPHSLREAALALGFPRWRTSLKVVVRTCLPGIVTGVLLAVARIAGETAPLLFTA
ncbi:MAG TPA: phosphate ABC transporter permease PstA, partial [Gemmatimonadales bacterium]|nr:phosphate ABC transporter permease PstA [Gemmatimonadales bacterium]